MNHPAGFVVILFALCCSFVITTVYLAHGHTVKNIQLTKTQLTAKNDKLDQRIAMLKESIELQFNQIEAMDIRLLRLELRQEE